MRGVYVRSLIDSPDPIPRECTFVFSPKTGPDGDTATDFKSEASVDSFDSFVVPDDFVEYEEEPEPIENNLEKPKNARSTRAVHKKGVVRKKRRVFICEASDSDETEEVPKLSVSLPKPAELKPSLSKSEMVKALGTAILLPKTGPDGDTTTDFESDASVGSFDSFVVPDDFVEYEEEPEPIENNLEKPKNARSTRAVHRKAVVRKKRRVFICEASDSDETEEVPKLSVSLPKPAELKPSLSKSEMVKALGTAILLPKTGPDGDTTTDFESEASVDSFDSFVVPDDFVEYEEEPEPIENNLEKLKSAHSTRAVHRKGVVRKKRRAFICETSDSDETEEVPKLSVSLPKPVELKPSLSKSEMVKALGTAILLPKTGPDGDTTTDFESDASVGSFDSFVVPDDFVEYEEEPEPIENNLEKPINAHSTRAVHRKGGVRKKRRVFICEASDSDETEEFPKLSVSLPKPAELKPSFSKSEMVKALASEPVSSGQTDRTSPTVNVSPCANSSIGLDETSQSSSVMKPLVLIGLHQICPAKRIASALRTSFDINVYVCSLVDCDYVLSNRMVCRRVFYSDDSAKILAQLAQSEARRGYGIHWDPNFSRQELRMLKFYRSFACITYLSSFNLVKNFDSIEAVMRSSTNELMSKGKMLRHQAELFYHFIHERIDTSAHF
ncbi:Fanconi anemia group M protein [Trichuris trichiura]|uniref:Fanconi anemia group M protein n=1 Tax=Trichuris trichiura TaxID=36087 RepID=A0A077ZDX5_TRITR|nr:Fanconi anemia group M protein [Trichuris trichiura]